MGQLPGYSPDCAFFLDLDGTLLEIADHPQHVRAPPRLKSVLERLHDSTGGSVAVVSGRSIADVDRQLSPLTLPVAGLHGLERRDASGYVHYGFLQDEIVHHIKHRLMAFAERHPGLLLEDKGPSVALHYRSAQALRPVVEAEMHEVARQAGERFELQQGKMVLELKPSGRDKGDAIREYMSETPFEGRLPVFAGDDVTDEAGFRAVNEMGGYSIRVGARDESAARFTLTGPAGLLDWLEGYLRLPQEEHRKS